MKRTTKSNESITESTARKGDQYPGTAIDIADDEKVNPSMVRDRVKVENNNPRNHDLND